MLEIIRLICPFPTVDKAMHKFHGTIFFQPLICAKCDKRCWDNVLNTDEDVTHIVCDTGISLISLKFPGGRLLCNGLLVKIYNTDCNPQVRKRMQSHKIFLEEVASWHQNISNNIPKIEFLAEQKASELVDSLHNVKAAINVVNRNTEAIIAGLEGDTDDEKIENAEPRLKSLLKSVELLNSRLPLASIVNNLESASYGQRRPVPIYKLFHRMVRLFEELASQKRVFIKMYGASFNNPHCYDSFESISLVLIDNAVKYAQRNSEVEVLVYDQESNSVEVIIKSYGELIPLEDRDKIFEKRFRSQQANKIVSSGSGLGLYIAKTVAAAHQFVISYSCEADKRKQGFGKNIFSFLVNDLGR